MEDAGQEGKGKKQPEQTLDRFDAGAFANLLFEEAPCYFSILDPHLRIIKANRRCREDFATLYTRHCYQAYKDRSEICPDCPARVTLEESRICDSEEVLTDRSGNPVHVFCRTAPIKDDSGKVAGVLHMSVQAGEGEVLQHDVLALESQISAVSHGIKGLLTSMDGGMYLWDSGLEGSDPKRMEKGLDIVRRNLHRLKHFAHDIVYYIRRRDFKYEKLDAFEIMKKVAESFGEEARRSNAKINVLEPAENLTVSADARAIESALANLTASSLEDCRADNRDIGHEIRLCARVENGWVVFEVSDNGVGMDPETLDKIFSLFFNPKGIESSGIGLFIANKIARAHKGEVDIQSAPGEGATYRLRIPPARG